MIGSPNATINVMRMVVGFGEKAAVSQLSSSYHAIVAIEIPQVMRRGCAERLVIICVRSSQDALRWRSLAQGNAWCLAMTFGSPDRQSFGLSGAAPELREGGRDFTLVRRQELERTSLFMRFSLFHLYGLP
jgi:hypothetical protein